MTPYAVYIDERSVSVQWDDRGPFVTLHEDGTVTEQFREPHGRRIGDADDIPSTGKRFPTEKSA